MQFELKHKRYTILEIKVYGTEITRVHAQLRKILETEEYSLLLKKDSFSSGMASNTEKWLEIFDSSRLD